MRADDFTAKAAGLLQNRGEERDQPNGERSMARCVAAFNAMTNHELTTEDGWLFMIYLKHSRMRGGAYRQDDYEDAVGYEALMAEEAYPSDSGINVQFLKGNEVLRHKGCYMSVDDIIFTEFDNQQKLDESTIPDDLLGEESE